MTYSEKTSSTAAILTRCKGPIATSSRAASQLMSPALPTPAFSGAEGFGGMSQGGQGGNILYVNPEIEDVPNKPKKDSLRWALNQEGPRIIKFTKAGTITLNDRMIITQPFLTIDGSDAPGEGICIRAYPLELQNTHDVVMRYIRIRPGDTSLLKNEKTYAGSNCVHMSDSHAILMDHCSLSWSYAQILNINRCNHVTIQWCMMTEPLLISGLDPWSDRYPFGINISMSTVSLHHCLFAHYLQRGLMKNKMTHRLRDDATYDVKMEVINNVFFDFGYGKSGSGSHYTTGIGDNSNNATNLVLYQFLNNYYLNKNDTYPEIEADLTQGISSNEQLNVHFSGNFGPRWVNNPSNPLAGVTTSDGQPMNKAPATVRAQISDSPLFKAPIPVTLSPVREAYEAVLAQAGCSLARDEVDKRIIKEVKKGRFTGLIRSQEDVGGWPTLKQTREPNHTSEDLAADTNLRARL